MDGLRIIPVTNEELIYALSTIAEEIWHEHYDPIIGEAQVDYMLEKYLSLDALIEQINSGYEYFLLSYEYTFAGFAGVCEKDGTLFLSKLYVYDEFRGLGLASHMMKQFIDLCETRSLSKIWLTCNRNNTTTLDIYNHLGFEVVREEVTDIGNGFVMDDYVLEYVVEK